MIEAKELRIGNWLWYESDMYSDRQGKIHENWFQVKYIGGTIGLDIGFDATQRFEKNPIWSPKIEELLPISLTPEILEKCGFVKRKTYGIEMYKFKQLELIKSSFGADEYFTIDNEPHFYPLLKFIHQLQNLYFALTGEELNIEM